MKLEAAKYGRRYLASLLCGEKPCQSLTVSVAIMPCRHANGAVMRKFMIISVCALATILSVSLICVSNKCDCQHFNTRISFTSAMGNAAESSAAQKMLPALARILCHRSASCSFWSPSI
eukprot:31729_1